MASKTADLPYMKLLVELGADPLRPNQDGLTPLMAAAGIGTVAPTEEAGTEAECLEAVEYLLTLGADVNTVDTPEATQFVTDFKAAYGDPPGIYAGEGWDVAQIYIAAMKDGNTDRDGITKFITDLSGFQGLTKTYSFQANGELDDAAVVTFFYENDGSAWNLVGPSTDVLGG